MDIRLESKTLTLVVSTSFGAIRHFSATGPAGMVPLLRPCPAGGAWTALDAACFPLVPFGNRVRRNRFAFGNEAFLLAANSPDDPLYLHGDGWLAEWSVQSSGTTFLRLSLAFSGAPHTPYIYDAQQSFRLVGSGLEIGLRVVNRGNRTLPFGLGWHPYFPLTAGTTLQAPATTCWSEDTDHLPERCGAPPPDLDFTMPRPLPERWINNAFEGWNGRAEICWPERNCALVVTAERPLSHYTLFQPGHFAGNPFFCLEPMSHRPDGHQASDLSGLLPLPPGSALEAEIRLEAFFPAARH